MEPFRSQALSTHMATTVEDIFFGLVLVCRWVGSNPQPIPGCARGKGFVENHVAAVGDISSRLPVCLLEQLIL